MPLFGIGKKKHGKSSSKGSNASSSTSSKRDRATSDATSAASPTSETYRSRRTVERTLSGAGTAEHLTVFGLPEEDINTFGSAFMGPSNSNHLRSPTPQRTPSPGLNMAGLGAHGRHVGGQRTALNVPGSAQVVIDATGAAVPPESPQQVFQHTPRPSQHGRQLSVSQQAEARDMIAQALQKQGQELVKVEEAERLAAIKAAHDREAHFSIFAHGPGSAAPAPAPTAAAAHP